MVAQESKVERNEVPLHCVDWNHPQYSDVVLLEVWLRVVNGMQHDVVKWKRDGYTTAKARYCPRDHVRRSSPFIG